MPVNAEFIDLLKDLMRGLGPVTSKRMFGGAGIYADGVMFALIADDVLFLKTDENTRARYEAENLGPFIFESKDGKKTAMSYWCAPERLLDEPDEMCEWAGEALAVARRLAAAKPQKKKKQKTKKAAKKVSSRAR